MSKRVAYHQAYDFFVPSLDIIKNTATGAYLVGIHTTNFSTHSSLLVPHAKSADFDINPYLLTSCLFNGGADSKSLKISQVFP